MSLPNLTGVGRLTEDPSIRFSPQGVAVLTVNLAFNSRKKNQQTGEWEDDSVFFVRGTAFKDLAEQAGESLSRGDEVIVSGRLKTEKWQDKQSGENRSATSLIIDSIGPNLARATAKVNKVERGGGRYPDGSTPRTGGPVQQQETGDPWGSSQGQDQEIPF